MKLKKNKKKEEKKRKKEKGHLLHYPYEQ